MNPFSNRDKAKMENELEKLVEYEGSGGGFGDPARVRAHQEEINLLKHKLELIEARKAKTIAIWSLAIAFLSLLVSFYTVFFPKP
ncbi:MAG: hypothetical protein H7831_04760 [Magnetococcus sp. WYHC-3]